MKTKVIVLAKTLVAVIGGLGLLATIIVVTPRVRADSLATEKNNHLISVDGLRQFDLAWYVQSYPPSNWLDMSALLS